MDISSILFVNLYKSISLYRKLTTALSITGEESFKLVLHWSAADSLQPAAHLLSNRQRLCLHAIVVRACRQWNAPAHIKFLEAELLPSAFM